jgi:ubiquinone/menaquinone biosynthesis C-methylase UbiE
MTWIVNQNVFDRSPVASATLISYCTHSRTAITWYKCVGLETVQVSAFKTSAWQSQERADLYHERTVSAPKIFQILRHDLYLRYIERFTFPGAKILDLGCGSGLLSVPLHDNGYKIVACDVSQAMLNRASANFGLRAIETRLGSGFSIPAQDGEFDMVVSRMFMAHFPDWVRILREKARVTRPDGFVIFDFGNREHVSSPGRNGEPHQGFPYSTDTNIPEKFYAIASEEEMHAAASECGLEVVTIIPHGLLLNNMTFHEAVGQSGVDEFNAKLDDLLRHEEARELLLLLEESFVSRMPKQTTYGNVVVLRRVMPLAFGS